MCQFLWQSVLREHCCSQSGGTHCCSQSHSQTVQPEWWEPLVVAVTAAAKVVAASVLKVTGRMSLITTNGAKKDFPKISGVF